MIQLIAAQSGRVGIAGQRYTRGLLRVRYGLDGSVTIWDPFGIVLVAYYADFLNPVTGLSFPDLRSLKGWIEANFFRLPAGYVRPTYVPALQINGATFLVNGFPLSLNPGIPQPDPPAGLQINGATLLVNNSPLSLNPIP